MIPIRISRATREKLRNGNMTYDDENAGVVIIDAMGINQTHKQIRSLLKNKKLKRKCCERDPNPRLPDYESGALTS